MLISVFEQFACGVCAALTTLENLDRGFEELADKLLEKEGGRGVIISTPVGNLTVVTAGRATWIEDERGRKLAPVGHPEAHAEAA